MFKGFRFVSLFFIVFLVCSLAPASAISQKAANNAADHIVSELQHKHFFAYKTVKPLPQLGNNTIVQLVNEKGYFRYVIYDGITRTDKGVPIVLINKVYLQSQRYMTLENFQKEYTGNTITISTSKSPMDMTCEIWEIQGNDLKKDLKKFKKQKDMLEVSIDFISLSLSLYGIILLREKQRELGIVKCTIARIEDEMIYLGFIGA